MSSRGDFEVVRNFMDNHDEDYGLEIRYKGAPTFFVDSDIAADMLLAMFEELPGPERERVLVDMERFFS